ncbi:MAG: M23 family metallopeptidase [Salinivirgaceae bacterium]|nr:M23 family metallopeptidase [Salinivirgaceae bacterium]
MDFSPRLIIVLLVSKLFIASLAVNAQKPVKRFDDFMAPVDIEMLLSGNFAELRGSHFHTGIDIKTQAQSGFNIYSIDEGYVSRIKVSPYGYGNALYIRHPSGYTSVYAHLDKFNIQIEQYVREVQYERRKFAVDLFPSENLIQVSKGDVIGLSGNSGGSMGPHLHFEIRKTANEKPQNPLFWNFDIKDNIAPRFHRLLLYPLSASSEIERAGNRKVFGLNRLNNNYTVKGYNIIEVADTIGIGVHVNDYLNGSYNRCGVYDLKVKANNRIIYQLTMDELSFAENRYILSHIDYDLNRTDRIKAHRCFLDEGNKFSGYKTVEDHGRLYVAPGEEVPVEVIAEDVYGNTSTLHFTLRGRASQSHRPQPAAAQILRQGETNQFQRSDVILTLPRNALYRDVFFNYEKRTGTEQMFSDIHTLHTSNEPLHKHFNIAVKAPGISDALKDKIYLASVADNGYTYSASSNIRFADGWAHTRIRSFGSYALMADTVAPEIAFLNIYDGKDMISDSQIRIKINDTETGIKSYNGFINDKWVLFEYDAKNDLLQYSFDEHMPEAVAFILKIVVEDNKHNRSVKRVKFSRSDATSKR